MYIRRPPGSPHCGILVPAGCHFRGVCPRALPLAKVGGSVSLLRRPIRGVRPQALPQARVGGPICPMPVPKLVKICPIPFPKQLTYAQLRLKTFVCVCSAYSGSSFAAASCPWRIQDTQTRSNTLRRLNIGHGKGQTSKRDGGTFHHAQVKWLWRGRARPPGKIPTAAAGFSAFHGFPGVPRSLQLRPTPHRPPARQKSSLGSRVLLAGDAFSDVRGKTCRKLRLVPTWP